MDRRETLKLMVLAPLAGSFALMPGDVREARRHFDGEHDEGDQKPGIGSAPEFFTDREYDTVRVLVDMILPADERSGSATEAGVPAFIDFMMRDRPHMQTPTRGGLAWINYQCIQRFGDVFASCSEAQRRTLLDEIAYPEDAAPEVSQGVAFFSSFRDLTASGFWTSKMGMDDLEYIGNTYVAEWTGCPEEVQEYLGVSYEGE